MRNSRPLQWIEETEASVVLSAARFERTPRVSRGPRMAARLAALRSWLTQADAPMGWTLQVRPVPVRVASGRQMQRRADDERCERGW